MPEVSLLQVTFVGKWVVRHAWRHATCNSLVKSHWDPYTILLCGELCHFRKCNLLNVLWHKTHTKPHTHIHISEAASIEHSHKHLVWQKACHISTHIPTHTHVQPQSVTLLYILVSSRECICVCVIARYEELLLTLKKTRKYNKVLIPF